MPCSNRLNECRYTEEEQMQLMQDCINSRRDSTNRNYEIYQAQFRVRQIPTER